MWKDVEGWQGGGEEKQMANADKCVPNSEIKHDDTWQ